MNILILGEYSGFAKHLKIGFKKLGHNVTVVMKPDSFKKFKGDEDDVLYGYNLSFRGKPIRGSALLLTPFRALSLRQKLEKRYKTLTPDLIIVINYEFISTSLFFVGPTLRFLERLVNRGAKLIMSVCGLDPAYYHLYPDYYKIAGVKAMGDDDRYSYLITHADAIIPTGYSYYSAISKYSNDKGFGKAQIKNAIPLPIKIEDNYNYLTCEGRKIVIFHGIIRPEAKGTPFIKAAMERLQEEMPDKVECVCRGNMPYDEYVKLFDGLDILIDQTYGNAWGMNAEIGASKAKCVLTGCGCENEINMGIQRIPFVQIGPDSDQIYQTLRDLVLSPYRIDEIKVASRKFAEEYCECSLIAKKYIEAVGL